MNTPDEKTTYTRREFNTFFALLLTMFTAASTSRAGIDAATKTSRRKKRRGKIATAEEIAGAKLVIDLPTEEGWYIVHMLASDEWKRIDIDPDNLSPAMTRQLVAAKAAPHGTPVAVRVLGDVVAVLDKCSYFAPGEPDDRCFHDEIPEESREALFPNWRLEYFGDGIRRVQPDNNSWWQARLAHGPEFSAREIAFAEYWLKENNEDRMYAINSGCGLAQDLMLSTYQHEKPEGFEPWLTNRERKILATFVQWLGTNCGQSFLYEVARKGGIPILHRTGK